MSSDPLVEVDATELDELFTIPPDRFTTARNELARRLRQAGRRDAAGAVMSLSRPPLAIWALNRLTREQPTPVDDFLTAAAALRKAQNEGGDIRAATRPEREAEAQLVDAAEKLVRSAGGKVTQTVLDTLRRTLRAAAADPDAAAELKRGRLTAELEAPTVEELLSHVSGSVARGAASRRKAEERQQLRDDLDEARARVALLRRDERAAAAEERALRSQWERARRAAEQASAELDEAEAAAAEIQARLRGLRSSPGR